MGFLDDIMGRRRPPKPDLDQLFGLPAAAVTLEAELGFAPTGTGSVGFRAPAGRAMADVEAEVRQLLPDRLDRIERDRYGYTWAVLTTDPPDVGTLVTDLHAVNSSLADSGFGPTLLATLVPFVGTAAAGSGRVGQRLALVYLYKRGSFYPFAPVGAGPQEHQRDPLLERQVRDAVTDDLRLEPEAERWFGLWGAPGL